MPPEWVTDVRVYVYDTEAKKWYALERGDIKEIAGGIGSLVVNSAHLLAVAEYDQSNDFIPLDTKYDLTISAGELEALVPITPDEGKVLYVRSLSLTAPDLPASPVISAYYNVLLDGKALYKTDQAWTAAVTVDLVALLGKEIRASKVEVKIKISEALATERKFGQATVKARQAPLLY